MWRLGRPGRGAEGVELGTWNFELGSQNLGTAEYSARRSLPRPDLHARRGYLSDPPDPPDQTDPPDPTYSQLAQLKD